MNWYVTPHIEGKCWWGKRDEEKCSWLKVIKQKHKDEFEGNICGVLKLESGYGCSSINWFSSGTSKQVGGKHIFFFKI